MSPLRSTKAGEESASRAILTGREREIARLVAQGQSPVQIARELSLSTGTVETRVANVFRKLGATSRADVARAVISSSYAVTTRAASRRADTDVSLLRLDYPRGDETVLASIRAGIDPALWSQLRTLGFTTAEIASVVGINERTIARKQARDERLDIVEGDRTVRLAQIGIEAVHAFGDVDKALRWLRKPNRLLGDAPIELIRTEPGTALVRRALGMIEYGGVA